MADGGGPRVAFVVPERTDGNPYISELIASVERAGASVVRTGMTPRWLAEARRAGASVVHLHWNSYLVSSARGWASWLKVLVFVWQLVLARLRGVAVVWTVHNLRDHGGRCARQDRLASRAAARLVRRLIVHCPGAAGLAAEAFGVLEDRRFAVVEHAAYAAEPVSEEARRAFRSELGAGDAERVLLFFGRVQPYKGILDLIDAFSSVEGPGLRLVIAGKCDAGHEAELRARATDGRIVLRLGFVAEEDVAGYLASADAVVLPYRDILSSGSALLAVAYGRAVSAPATGCLPDVFAGGGAILYDPERPGALRGAVGQLAGASAERLADMGAANARAAERLTWDRMGRETVAVYRAAAGEGDGA